MKKLLAIVLALALCLGMVTMATAETTKYKIGVLVPAVTHGWVGGITYNAEQYCKELEPPAPSSTSSSPPAMPKK